MMDKRNTAAVEQQLKEYSVRVLAQQVRIDGLVATMGGMQERLNALELSLNMMRAQIAGRGPTV